MALTQVVTAAANSPTTTSSSQTWTTGRTLIVIAGGAIGSDSVDTITQSSGTNNWAPRPQAISNVSPGHEVWVAENITGFTGTISVNWSGSQDHAVIYAEYDEPTARTGVANMTTGSAANASATITPSDAVGARYIAGVVYNNTSTYTAGTGTLQAQVNGAGVSLALVDNTSGSIAVTHATGTFRIGIVELIPNAIEGGNIWPSGTPSETAVDYWTANQAGRSFTTGANAAGYRLCVVKALYDSISGGNVRGALYSNEGSPNNVRRAFSAADVGGLTNAGANTLNMVAAPLSFTMAANTTYWATMNVDSGHTQWQDGTAGPTTYRGIAFGTPPSPWGTLSTDPSGLYIWATYQAIGGATPTSLVTPRPPMAHMLVR